MRSRGWVLGLVATVTMASSARPAAAEDGPTATLAGPVFGLTWKRGTLLHGLIGVEAGFGLRSLLQLNGGLTWRDGEVFAYTELDGWFVVGATAGVGYGTRSEWQPVVGVWEAIPAGLDDSDCDHSHGLVISFGYRWTGMHEVYVAPKYGVIDDACLFH